MNPTSSKSNWTAAITAVVNLFYQLNKANNWIELPDGSIEATNTVMLALWGIFMRQGIAKSGPQEESVVNNEKQDN